MAGPRVFLSHKSNDRELASQFKTKLLACGMMDEEVFVSEEIEPGSSWEPRIIEALTKSDTLVLLYTDPSLTCPQ